MPRTIRLKTALTVLGLAATLVQPVTAGAQTNTNALDAASNYSSFTGNQGFGFGPWTLSTAGGGAYLSGDTPKLWGIWNNTANAVSSATRTFNTPLAVGSTFTCDYRLGNLDSTRQTNAVRLLDAGGNVVFSFYHLGGDNANGWYTDASGTGVATGFTYNYAANTHLRFALTSANAYTFTDDTTGASFTGTTTGATITQVQFWRANGDSPAPGNGQDLKFSNLMVTSPAGTPPAISAQPVNGVAIAGSSATISAAASSSQPLNYQWYFNNNALAGATANNLVLPTVGLTNAGNYVVVAYNSLGAATSSVAVLAVLPFGYTNAADVAANYSSFTGNQGFGFGPWVLSTAGGGSYLSGDHPPEFGIWNNTGGGASRATRALTTPLSPNASFLVQLQIMSLDNSDNQDGIELHDAAGNVLFSYWHQGGDTTDGHYQDANGPGTATGFAYDYGQLDAFAFTLTSANTYTFYDLTTGVNFSGILAGGPIAEVAFVRTNGSTGGQSGGQDFKFTGLTVVSTNGNPPTFTQQPQYNGGLAGATLTLNSAAVSTLGNPGYQWFFNQTSLTGRTNATLLLTNLSTVNAGNYFVVATNIFGRTTSAVAVVTVYLENERLLAYEGFNYSADPTPVDNTTQNGGYGWNGAWQIVGGTGNFIMSGSLAGAGLVPTGYDLLSTGNSYFNFGSSRMGRYLDCSTNGAFAARGFLDTAGNIGAAGKTIYVSFLMQPDTTTKFYEVEFHRTDLGDPGRLAGVGNDTGNTNVYFRQPAGPFVDLGLGDSANDPSFGNHAVDFYVVRIDYQPGHADNATIYRNPTSNVEPAIPTATVTNAGNLSFNGLSLGAYGNLLAADEIRIGATWADAVGLPGNIALLAPQKSGGNYTVKFLANPAYTYRVQRASDLTGTWTDMGTLTPTESGLGSFTDTTPPAGQAYYRVVTP